jgi:hypothetical protein
LIRMEIGLDLMWKINKRMYIHYVAVNNYNRAVYAWNKMYLVV